MMKMKNLKQFNFKLQALLLCGICSCGILSSCSNSEDINNKTSSAIGNQLVLTINTANPNGPQASALSNTLKNVKIGSRATNLTPTAGETPGDDKNENQINRLTVGVFSSDGNTVRTIQEYTKDGTNKFTQSGSTTTATVTTTSLAKDDKVLVAVNAPTGLFSSVQKSSDFNKVVSIDRALATSSAETSSTTTEAADNIPMYGFSTIAQAEDGSYSSAVSVQHQVAKITVASVGVDFDPNGPYKSAIFQPTAFFLTNVPDNLNFTMTAATGSSTVWQQGGDASATATYKAYLGTGDITTYAALKIGGTTSDAINKFFYTMPNSVVANNTKLIIKGKFSADGSAIGDATPEVYYPVNINWVYNGAVPDGGTAKTVSPNTNYNCTVTIKTKGTDDPSKSIDPSVASINVTVKPFTTVNEATAFE